MFKNIGKKLKTITIVLFVICVIASYTGAIILFTQELILFGVLLLILGPVVFFVLFSYLYGFCELVDNSTIIAKQYLENPDNNIEKINDKHKNIIIPKEKPTNKKEEVSPSIISIDEESKSNTIHTYVVKYSFLEKTSNTLFMDSTTIDAYNKMEAYNKVYGIIKNYKVAKIISVEELQK